MSDAPPPKGLVASLAQVRAAGKTAPPKVVVRTRHEVTLEFVERGDGGWHLYGHTDPAAPWRRDFDTLEELEAYLHQERPKSVTLLARVPMLRTEGKMSGAWQIQLCEVAEVVKLVGEDTFVAFLKCYVGSDRLKTLLQFYVHTGEKVGRDTPAGDRNFHVSWLLVVGTLHELGDALQELCNTKVYSKLADKTVWEPLDKLRAKWKDHRVGKRMRDQGGHHLGERDVYKRGLAELGKASLDAAFLVGEGQGTYGDIASCAWDVLLRGIATPTPDGRPELDVADLRRLLDDATDAHRELHHALAAVFDEALRTAGVAVVHQATE